jgi:hypothetical protein
MALAMIKLKGLHVVPIGTCKVGPSTAIGSTLRYKYCWCTLVAAAEPVVRVTQTTLSQYALISIARSTCSSRWKQLCAGSGRCYEVDRICIDS